MEEPVTLIVKAPNQQIEDQTIHCEINWSVKRLKDHLSEVYPSTPRPEDQKLIYSGQLLNDSVVLKDILRMYEGQENHTVHLVCSPPKETHKTSSIPKKPTTPMTPLQPAAQEQTGNSSPSSTSGDGVRQRFTPTFVPQPPQSWPFAYTQAGVGTQPAAPVWPTMGTYDAASMAQQMVYMQQAYAQYMAQYMQLMASGNIPAGMQVPPSVNTPPPAAPAPALHDEPLPGNDVAQNGAEDAEDMRANRDWLDWFYVMSRMLVLFSIVYFYSSPVRFFVVSTLGIIMYLYQVGFFRAVNRLEQQDEAPVVPPPTPDNNNVPPPPEAPPAPPSALALTWAAFSSFFLSLIPEQPNVL